MDDVAGCFEYYAGLAVGLDAKQGSPVDVGDARCAARCACLPPEKPDTLACRNMIIVLSVAWFVVLFAYTHSCSRTQST